MWNIHETATVTNIKNVADIPKISLCFVLNKTFLFWYFLTRLSYLTLTSLELLGILLPQSSQV